MRGPDMNLDRMVLKIVGADRFRPGTHNGAPVFVGQSVEVVTQACIEETPVDEPITMTDQVHLISTPAQKFTNLTQEQIDAILGPGLSPVYPIGDGVTAPAPLNNVQVEFSDEARRAKYQGICLLSLIVDTNGMPQNVHVERPLGYGLSEKAVEAVHKYRFKPAMKDGMPVPVIIHVEINFRLYLR
jgi:TonB family protein